MFPTNPAAQEALNKIPEALSKGASGIIFLPQNPTQDAIASACSLYLALSKSGKNVTIACSSPVQSDFIGADKIQNNMSTGGNNLVISFPFKEDALDKVDYGFQGDFFNVIVSPRPGLPKLEPNSVKFSYTGGNLDFIITIDSPNLNSLGAIYAENQNEFAGKNIINIDRHLVNDQFGTVNFVVKTASSTSELIFKVLQAMQIQLDKEIATNLYNGVMVATNNFTSYSVNADTFAVASTLLQAGALKRPTAARPPAPGMSPMAMPDMQPMNRPRMPMPPMPMPMDEFDDEDDEFEDVPVMSAPMRNPAMSMPQRSPQEPFRFPQPQQPMNRPPMPPPQPRPQPPRPMPQQVPPQMDETMKPVEEVEVQPGTTPEAASSTPQDWLKPKIFKGGGGLV